MHISEEQMQTLLRLQKDELNGHLAYQELAKRIKDPEDKQLVQQIAADEKHHHDIWQLYTQQTVTANRLLLFLYKFLGIFFGYTFAIEQMEKTEALAVSDYYKLIGTYPEADEILRDEQAHEKELLAMLDEERLHYVGSMILGLNDALVELTGTIAGLTFAMANNRLVALSAIITGIAATLSMALQII